MDTVEDPAGTSPEESLTPVVRLPPPTIPNRSQQQGTEYSAVADINKKLPVRSEQKSTQEENIGIPITSNPITSNPNTQEETTGDPTTSNSPLESEEESIRDKMESLAASPIPASTDVQAEAKPSKAKSKGKSSNATQVLSSTSKEPSTQNMAIASGSDEADIQQKLDSRAARDAHPSYYDHLTEEERLQEMQIDRLKEEEQRMRENQIDRDFRMAKEIHALVQTPQEFARDHDLAVQVESEDVRLNLESDRQLAEKEQNAEYAAAQNAPTSRPTSNPKAAAQNAPTPRPTSNPNPAKTKAAAPRTIETAAPTGPVGQETRATSAAQTPRSWNAPSSQAHGAWPEPQPGENLTASERMALPPPKTRELLDQKPSLRLQKRDFVSDKFESGFSRSSMKSTDVEVKLVMSDPKDTSDRSTVTLGHWESKEGYWHKVRASFLAPENWYPRLVIQVEFYRGTKCIVKRYNAARFEGEPEYKDEEEIRQERIRTITLAFPFDFPWPKSVNYFRVTDDLNRIAHFGSMWRWALLTDSGQTLAHMSDDRIGLFNAEVDGTKILFQSSFMDQPDPYQYSLSALPPSIKDTLEVLERLSKLEAVNLAIYTVNIKEYKKGEKPEKKPFSTQAMKQVEAKEDAFYALFQDHLSRTKKVYHDDPCLSTYNRPGDIGRAWKKGGDANNPPALKDWSERPTITFPRYTHPGTLPETYLPEVQALAQEFERLEVLNRESSTLIGEIRLVKWPEGGDRMYIGTIRPFPDFDRRMDDGTRCEGKFVDREGKECLSFSFTIVVSRELELPGAAGADIPVLVIPPRNPYAQTDPEAPPFMPGRPEHIFDTSALTEDNFDDFLKYMKKGDPNHAIIQVHESDKVQKQQMKAHMEISPYNKRRDDPGTSRWAQSFKTGRLVHLEEREDQLRDITPEQLTTLTDGLTEQQGKFFRTYLRSVGKGKAILRGTAGTGKSELSSRLAVHKASTGTKVLVCGSSNAVTDMMLNKIHARAEKCKTELRLARLHAPKSEIAYLQQMAAGSGPDPRFQRFQTKEIGMEFKAALLVQKVYTLLERTRSNQAAPDPRITLVTFTIPYLIMKEAGLIEILNSPATQTQDQIIVDPAGTVYVEEEEDDTQSDAGSTTNELLDESPTQNATDPPKQTATDPAPQDAAAVDQTKGPTSQDVTSAVQSGSPTPQDEAAPNQTERDEAKSAATGTENPAAVQGEEPGYHRPVPEEKQESGQPPTLTKEQEAAFIEKYSGQQIVASDSVASQRSKALTLFRSLMHGKHCGQRGKDLNKSIITVYKELYVDFICNHVDILFATTYGAGFSVLRKAGIGYYILEEAQSINLLEMNVFYAQFPKVSHLIVGSENQMNTRTVDFRQKTDPYVNEAWPTVGGNILEQACSQGRGSHVLTENMRSHPNLVKPISDLFYKEDIRSIKKESDFPAAQQLISFYASKGRFTSGFPMIFLNLSNANSEQIGHNLSKRNTIEGDFANEHLNSLLGCVKGSIRIITGYQAQVRYIRSTTPIHAVNNTVNEGWSEAQRSTVFRSLGDEADIIIFALTASSAPGYIDDKAFLVTALTRAKAGVIIVGAIKHLHDWCVQKKRMNSPLFKLLDWGRQNGLWFNESVSTTWTVTPDTEPISSKAYVKAHEARKQPAAEEALTAKMLTATRIEPLINEAYEPEETEQDPRQDPAQIRAATISAGFAIPAGEEEEEAMDSATKESYTSIGWENSPPAQEATVSGTKETYASIGWENASPAQDDRASIAKDAPDSRDDAPPAQRKDDSGTLDSEPPALPKDTSEAWESEPPALPKDTSEAWESEPPALPKDTSEAWESEPPALPKDTSEAWGADRSVQSSEALVNWDAPQYKARRAPEW